ncbi:SUMF1/EgtB/PvdO family nonheme iron enzyme [Mesorhizobium sp. LNJC405B00]|uniref:SUMF1/EgtB/PvdO family nonheme iron enzyme n=1 Tax=Mesorhizobium sp. LNJC405B00 TaxID=1287281 RepID=UPI0003CF7307|nr:SUMF1/EgtB/PvdO family nonheme iron enzyme [Mesorhizobium sp. LNJC405B00]ESY01340.1 hypothetical protein X755_06470 [Mesorhizobium sp. LNJC405B00]
MAETKTRSVVALASLLFWLLAITTVHAQDVTGALEADTVAISNGAGSNGFGLVVASRGGLATIVTAAHVVRDDNGNARSPVMVKFAASNSTIQAAVLDVAFDGFDLAVIQAKEPAGFALQTNIVGNSADLRRGERLWIVGAVTDDITASVIPGAFAKFALDGTIVAQGLGAVEGNSGGPLFGTSGVVGIIFNAFGSNTGAATIETIENAFSRDNLNLPWDLRSAKARKPRTVFSDCEDCPDMVVLTPGSFDMGANSGVDFPDPSFMPAHRVTISYDFAVGQVEVTGPQWLRCVREKGCPKNIGYTVDPYTRTPVEFISHKNAVAYTNWLSSKTGAKYRLLTEAEWEYAARAGTTTAFIWGDDMTAPLPAVCWGCGGDTDGSKTKAAAPVARYPSNTFGLADMAGNVSEIVSDCWQPDYSGAPDEGSAVQADGCSQRVVRGGSYMDPPLSLRSFARTYINAEDASQSVGFRVARDLH